MSKIIQKTFKIILIIVVSIIALLFILPIAFKGKIMKTAQEQANANLNAIVSFSDISLSMFSDFPNLSIKLKEMNVVGVDTFKNDTLIKFKSLNLGVNLMSVISGNEIKINAIELIQPDIKALVLANGKANWDIVKEDSSAIDEDVNNEADTTSSSFKINLKKLEITQAKVYYDDKTMATTALLENWNFLMKGDMTQQFTNLDIKTVIEKLTVDFDGIKYFNKTKIDYNAIIAADLENSKYTFENNKILLNTMALNFDGFVAMPDTNIDMQLTFNAEKNTFKSLLSLIPTFYLSDFEGLQASGNFGLNGTVKGRYNALSMPAYTVNLFVENGKIQYPDLPKSIENINIKMLVDAKEGSGDEMLIDISKAHFEIAANPMDIRFYALMTAADIDMKGNFKGKIDFNSIKDVMPLDSMSIAGKANMNLNFNGKMSDIDNEQYDKFNADGTLNLTDFEYISADMPKFYITAADMEFSPQYLNLTRFIANTPQSDFNLNGKILNVFAYVFKDELLKANFNLNSKNIFVDEFMSSETSQTAENQAPAQESQSNSEPVVIPQNIDFTLKSEIKKFVYDSIDISNITGNIIVRNGIATMENVNMFLLGGETKITGSFNTQNEYNPTADFLLTFNKFEIVKIYESFMSIKKIAPITKYCEGKINGQITVKTIMDADFNPIYSTFDSKGYFASENIGIKNNKLFTSIADKTKYQQLAYPTLNDVKISYVMDDGNITIAPTKFKLSGTESEFGGTQNIDGTINYDLTTELPQSAATNVLTKLPLEIPSKIKVNINIGGTVENPKIAGFSSNITDAVKDQVLEKIEEFTGMTKEEAQKILDNAKKQAQTIIDAAKQKSDIIIMNADKAGQKLVSEAKTQGQKLVNEAKNPIAKKAAQVTADKLVKEAKEKAVQLNKEAKKDSQIIIDEAQKQADKIVADAQKKVEGV